MPLSKKLRTQLEASVDVLLAESVKNREKDANSFETVELLTIAGEINTVLAGKIGEDRKNDLNWLEIAKEMARAWIGIYQSSERPASYDHYEAAFVQKWARRAQRACDHVVHVAIDIIDEMGGEPGVFNDLVIFGNLEKEYAWKVLGRGAEYEFLKRRQTLHSPEPQKTYEPGLSSVFAPV